MKTSVIAFVAVILSATLVSSAKAATFEAASTCQPCHEDTHRSWAQSLHALSFTNPVFTLAYQKAYTETAGEAKKLCLPCHAPTTVVTGDFDATRPITREGITCDFCHSVTAVDLTNRAHPFTLAPGSVKRSALKDADTDAHKTAYSADFASSKLCAGCHGMTSVNGVKITDTYNEWKDSSYAKAGKVCQDCHMDHIPGKTATEGGRDTIHDHSLGRNMATMMESVALEAKMVSRTMGAVKIDLMVTNAKAGHAIPTGAVARKLLVDVSTHDRKGKVIETQRIVYRKVVADKNGVTLESDGEVFMNGATIVSDNRLKADESRKESLYFRKQPDQVATVTAAAFYEYEPQVVQKVTNRIPLSTVATIETK